MAFGIATVALLSDAAEIGLSEKAREKLVKDLLPEYGNPPLEHKTKFKLEGLLCGSLMVPETENHVLMVNISKYLTNQLRGVDNSKNGFDLWMREHMDIFLDEFFDEYNSRPYQQYALAPILSVAALTKSQEVRNAALNVIEQSLATIALQSNGLRRFSPFRRQPNYKDSTASFDGNGVMGLLRYTPVIRNFLLMIRKILGHQSSQVLSCLKRYPYARSLYRFLQIVIKYPTSKKSFTVVMRSTIRQRPITFYRRLEGITLMKAVQRHQ